MEKNTPELNLPGFRFRPTEQELIDFYLRKKVLGKTLREDIIGFLNIYHHDPSELPGLAKIGEREWYFFVPRNSNGRRLNRTTKNGFWKATGSDRKVRSLDDSNPQVLGLKKTLVFYKGRAPRGSKTDWIMNEFRMPTSKDIVLCKIYRKAISTKELEQRALVKKELTEPQDQYVSPSSTLDTASQENEDDLLSCIPMADGIVFKTEQEEYKEPIQEFKEVNQEVSSKQEVSLKTLPWSLWNNNIFPELQLPEVSMDWTQDSLLTQLQSPWENSFLMTAYLDFLNHA